MNTGSDNPLTKAGFAEEVSSSLEGRFCDEFVRSAWSLDERERCERGERADGGERCCDSVRK